MVRSANAEGLEMVPLNKEQEAELEVAELKMLRFSIGITRMDTIRNECIQGTAHVDSMMNKWREIRLRWYGHILKGENSFVGKRMVAVSVPNKRKRGRPKKVFMNAI